METGLHPKRAQFQPTRLIVAGRDFLLLNIPRRPILPRNVLESGECRLKRDFSVAHTSRRGRFWPLDSQESGESANAPFFGSGRTFVEAL